MAVALVLALGCIADTSNSTKPYSIVLWFICNLFQIPMFVPEECHRLFSTPFTSQLCYLYLLGDRMIAGGVCEPNFVYDALFMAKCSLHYYFTKVPFFLFKLVSPLTFTGQHDRHWNSTSSNLLNVVPSSILLLLCNLTGFHISKRLGTTILIFH